MKTILITLSLLLGLQGIYGQVSDAYYFVDPEEVKENDNQVPEENAKSMFKKGMDYVLIEGKEDPDKAFYWIKKSAEKGLPEAKAMLANFYLFGSGTAADPKTAFNWAWQAAQEEVPFACTLLGVMYLEGEGVSKDVKKGVKWMEKAKNLGDQIAQEMWEEQELWKLK